ncbi:hypothetical protein [Noviherbaspirillum galbum]|uniref:Uncharacterized protein n=1 Tax=Noviherbaspirillum galbum TaxID=2709383 RepID=A0A6B3SMK5_9BURK|nr:hypothetical protein [Noviherbaspirillum galbum]NEX62084.1 hypothetical protein [Noviherbaspirillum galbum]
MLEDVVKRTNQNAKTKRGRGLKVELGVLCVSLVILASSVIARLDRESTHDDLTDVDQMNALAVVRDAYLEADQAARSLALSTTEEGARRELETLEQQTALYKGALTNLSTRLSGDPAFMRLQSNLSHLADQVRRLRDKGEVDRIEGMEQFLDGERPLLRQQIVADIDMVSRNDESRIE